MTVRVDAIKLEWIETGSKQIAFTLDPVLPQCRQAFHLIVFNLNLVHWIMVRLILYNYNYYYLFRYTGAK